MLKFELTDEDYTQFVRTCVIKELGQPQSYLELAGELTELIAEFGRVMELQKKLNRDNPLLDEFKDKTLKEAGDVEWSLVKIASYYDIVLIIDRSNIDFVERDEEPIVILFDLLAQVSYLVEVFRGNKEQKISSNMLTYLCHGILNDLHAYLHIYGMTTAQARDGNYLKLLGRREDILEHLKVNIVYEDKVMAVFELKSRDTIEQTQLEIDFWFRGLYTKLLQKLETTEELKNNLAEVEIIFNRTTYLPQAIVKDKEFLCTGKQFLISGFKKFTDTITNTYQSVNKIKGDKQC